MYARISESIQIQSHTSLDMPTDKLWMESIDSCYLQEFEAEITEVKDTSIVLDKTLFYPLGGGQNWDTGTITSDSESLQVTEVRGRDSIEHFVGENHSLNSGDLITGQIDWERRYAHMRMHTAQHIVSGLVYETFSGVRTVGNQIHMDRSRIDFNPVKFSDDMLLEVQNKVNDVIAEGLEVTDLIMTREEINRIMPPERTNMDLLPISVKELRVIKIGDNIDLCPCAGTHVRNLSEIGPIKFTGKKSKGRGTQRVEYILDNQ